MKKVDLKEYRYIRFWREESEDILCWSYAPNLEIDIVIAKEIVQNRLEYSKGKIEFALIDATNIKSTTNDARRYLSSIDGGLKGLACGAFVSKQTFTNVIINLFLQINKPPVPAKFFTERTEAIEWLRKISIEKVLH